MTFIDRTDDLARFCEEAAQEKLLALDMEFERERTYRAMLQLVQLATSKSEAVVDPLAMEDLSPLWDLVRDPEVEIIVHAGSQDMEIFFGHTEEVPHNVFDTQVAAGLLGMGEQPGYADLVRRLLNVRLKKGERTTDWSRRPLTDAQTEYALDDVRYLHPLRTRLREMLQRDGRVSWLQEELAFYAETSTYVKDPRMLWMRVSRHRSLDPRGLAILRELAHWREDTAMRRNIPRGRVIQDDVLVDLSRRRPTDLEQLRALRRLHPREAQRSGDALLDQVACGMAVEQDDLPQLSSIRDEDPQLELTADLLAVFLKFRARQLRIAPSYLATKKELSRLVGTYAAGRAELGGQRILTGWRHELVGKDLLRVLDSELSLAVRHPKCHLDTLESGQTLPLK